MTPDDDPNERLRAEAIYRALAAWIESKYGHEDPVVVLKALMYEISRLLAATAVGSGMTPAAVDDLIADFALVLKAHVAAFHRRVTQ